MVFRDLREQDYPAFLNLYNESFPVEERRLYPDTRHFADFVNEKGGKFNGFIAEDENGLFLGFLTYWKFRGFIYVEHFAVDPAHRGRKIGGNMLEYLFRTAGENVLIEVEKPETPGAARRIRFYERYGFRIRREVDYMQPPYSPEQCGLEMYLMTHGDVRLRGLTDLREMLAEVYNVL